MLIYQRDNFKVYTTNKGKHYIENTVTGNHVHDIRTEWVAINIIDNICMNVLPRTKNKYLLKSYLRLSKGLPYFYEIRELYFMSKGKKGNINKN